MAMSTLRGNTPQAFEECPFCSLVYARYEKTEIEFCQRCKLPLLPAKPTLTIVSEYQVKLRSLKTLWKGTEYQEKVTVQLDKIDRIWNIAQRHSLKSEANRTESAVPEEAPEPAAADANLALPEMEDRVKVLTATCQQLATSLMHLKNYCQERDRFFNDQITQLTRRLEVMQSLIESPEPVIEGQLLPPASIPSEPDSQKPWWLERYHLNPHDLEPSAISVDETAVSFQQRNGHVRVAGGSKTRIVFEKQSGSGKFWIIPSAEVLSDRKVAHLVPRWDAKFNVHDQQSLAAYFTLDETEQQTTGRYHVICPALLLALPQGEQWELVERGGLESFPDN
jgi:hypothetical protein